jgi:hypothetical protein
MQNHLTNSSALYRSGISPNRRLLKVPSGPYAGRMAVLIQTSPTEIKLSCSDYPYTSWTIPTLIIDDTADYPFDAVLDPVGNIFVAYTLNSSNDLVVRKLTFSSGVWSAGALTTLYNGDDNYYPSINIESSGRLWVSWSRLSSGQYYINVKYSTDGGTSWSGGPTSYGTALSAAATSAFSKILVSDPYLYAFYSLDGTKLTLRKKHSSASLWDDEVELASGSALDYNFDASGSVDGRIGVVFDDNRIRFREFDGNIWGALIDIDAAGGSFPQLKYFNNAPYIVYLSLYGADQSRLMYSCRLTDNFEPPAILDPVKDVLSKVLCYRAANGSYKDLTGAAADATAGDIYHADSGFLFKESSDALYLGLDRNYNYLKILLSAVGAGGTVSWQYFNGEEWIGFVPSGGNYHFTAADKELLLWDDYSSLPGDWQKSNLNGVEKFWLKVTVTTPFSTGPVGTQITCIPNLSGIILME